MSYFFWPCDGQKLNGGAHNPGHLPTLCLYVSVCVPDFRLGSKGMPFSADNNRACVGDIGACVR